VTILFNNKLDIYDLKHFEPENFELEILSVNILSFKNLGFEFSLQKFERYLNTLG
jgi:hypothetical protein